MEATALKYDVHYPESDGKPVGETQVHIQETFDLLAALGHYFRDVPDVFLASNLFLYYVENHPQFVICPDIFMARGLDKGLRRIYKLWEEKTPCLVIEVTSPSTRTEDLRTKKDLYERLGIEEYFLHDPLDEYLHPSLQGYRLEEGRYRPIEPAADGSLPSRTTSLTLRPEGQNLRLTEAATGKPLLFVSESQAQAEKATETEERVRALEEELARLQRERESIR